ncbi:DgyrCDS14606 [Dimorphilus gyrociliatus]|uniref:DgyrCDS14606 n=1 Tax=Dimorphilus gyrociliatus TaxID=2664684 RepID=A0A7I8WEK0_9ANNE|nr:DgyrCDS14606 [Dimorphilus gyrociliatus]
MNSNDLERVKLKEADAFLPLANPQAVDRDEEDASNILRVIAAKNFQPEIRVTVQLLSYENKVYLINLAPLYKKRNEIITKLAPK